jgi:hypothetical protein
MIYIYYNFCTYLVRSKLFDSKDHNKKFLLHSGVVKLGSSPCLASI